MDHISLVDGCSPWFNAHVANMVVNWTYILSHEGGKVKILE